MNMHDSIKMIQARLLPALDDEMLAQQYAGWLLEKVTGQTKSDLLTRDIELTDAMQTMLDGWLDDMIYHHKPIAYILQEVPFGDLSITVRPPVLIPRSETEEWVLHLISEIQKSGAQNLRILDMCTGSGCIALAFAHAFPDAEIYAADISSFALMLVKENKKKLGLPHVTCIESDLFSNIPHDLTFDLIVTNPPYITDKEFARLDPSVKNWEDARALFAEDNGLAIITKIIDQAPLYLRPNRVLHEHGIAQLSIEIGWQQGPAVQELMKKAGYTQVKVSQDIAHKDRVVSGSAEHVAIAADQK